MLFSAPVTKLDREDTTGKQNANKGNCLALQLASGEHELFEKNNMLLWQQAALKITIHAI